MKESLPEQSEEQRQKQWEMNIKPWQFKPGQSGNPGGRPKGIKTLKQFAKEYLQSLNDDEKLEYMKGMDKKIIWEMGEDKAKQATDITSGGEKVQFAVVNYGDKNTPVHVRASEVSGTTTESTG